MTPSQLSAAISSIPLGESTFRIDLGSLDERDSTILAKMLRELPESVKKIVVITDVVALKAVTTFLANIDSRFKLDIVIGNNQLIHLSAFEDIVNFLKALKLGTRIDFRAGDLYEMSCEQLTSLVSLVKPGMSINFSNDYLYLKKTEDLKEIFAAIKPGVSVNLNHAVWSHKTGEELIEIFAAIHPGVEMFFEFNDFTSKSSSELCAMLAAIKPGVTIHLSNTRFYERTGLQLRDMFASIKPGVRISLSGNGLWLKSTKELSEMFAALQPGVIIDLSDNDFSLKNDEELRTIFSSLQSGVSINIGFDFVLLRALQAIPPGVNLILSEVLSKRNAPIVNFLGYSPNINWIGLTEFHSLEHILSLPNSIEKITIYPEAWKGLSWERKLRIKLILESKFPCVEYYHYQEAQRDFLFYPTEGETWSNEVSASEAENKFSLLSMLEAWVDVHERDKRKVELLPYLQALITFSKNQLAKEKIGDFIIQEALFLTQEFLEGDLQKESYLAFIQSTHQANQELAQHLLHISSSERRLLTQTLRKLEVNKQYPKLQALRMHLEIMANDVVAEYEIERLSKIAKATLGLCEHVYANSEELAEAIKDYKQLMTELESTSAHWQTLGYLMFAFAAAAPLILGLGLVTTGTAVALSATGFWAIHRGQKNLSRQTFALASEVESAENYEGRYEASPV